MKGKRNIVIIFLIIIIVGTIGLKVALPYYKPINSGVVWENKPISHNEQILINFINNKLMTEDWGIKTNFKDEKSEGEITKGYSVLSESQGMMLLYYIDVDRKGEFDNILSYIKNNMILEDGVISWRIDEGKASSTSATIDDLRIVKALLLAEERWGDRNYRKLAVKISRAIKKELLDGKLLADFNDGTSKSDKTTICYLDIQTMKLLSNIDKDYKKIYESSLDLLNKSIISDEVPLYKKEYNRKNNEFDNEDIDMLLSSIVLNNMVQAGENVDKSIQWIKEKYKKDGAIFAKYSLDNVEATSNIESTSIYANLLCVASKVKDEELYNICLTKLKAYQIINEDNLIYGAYGDANTHEVYSFDNLNALLAWRKVNNN